MRSSITQRSGVRKKHPTSPRRLIRLVHLQHTQNNLNKTQKRRDNQDKNGNSEGRPLNTIPPIAPPLPEYHRFSIVIGLLQNNKAVSPEVETLDLPVFALRCPAPR
jgi:hypothetical protein